MFEESLHGVVVGLWQLSDQLFDGLNSLLVVWILCRTENKNRKSQRLGSLLKATAVFCWFTDAMFGKGYFDANVCEIAEHLQSTLPDPDILILQVEDFFKQDLDTSEVHEGGFIGSPRKVI